MNKILAFIIAISTFFASFFGISDKIDPSVGESDFEPILRFAVASDIHTQNFGDTNSHKLKKAIRTAYKIAQANESYNTLDAILLAGDITNNGRKDQFIALKATLDSCMQDETKLLAVIAHSHDGGTMRGNSISYFETIMNAPSDYHCVINGYHFIGISAGWEDNNGNFNDDAQREWLREQLEQAAADDPTKPIFVTHHEHILNTVYGSSSFDGWGTDFFKDIISEYPQVVDFSGHSHYPLNDPRSIWQGEFTAVGTGAIKYMEFTVDDERVVHPDNNDDTAQMWIVEVDANNRIRLCGYDMTSGGKLCEYIIEDPTDPSTFDFTPEKQTARSSAPTFGESAALSVKKSANVVTAVTFPAAESTDGYPVFLYRVNVYNTSGELVRSKWQLNEYWKLPLSDSITIKLDVPVKADSTIEVIAENAYGMQSSAITE